MKQKGSISILVLILGISITLAVSTMVILAITVSTSAKRTEYFERALSIAQAGADYYRWHLNHNIDDLTDGTGNTAGPYIHSLSDPYGNTEGTFALTITRQATGSSTITVLSEGWMNSYPDIKRRVKAIYGIPSFAQFSFLNNSNMWFGQKDIIKGKVFSNGGIRMDGTHDSTVESAKATYTCGVETGCDPPETKSGVWGDGGPTELWKYPSANIDFNSVGLNFSTMKQSAISTGVYLDSSSVYGYHITFQDNGTFSIYRVDVAESFKGWSVEGSCESIYQKIKNETYLGSYETGSKQIIFAEDNIWVDGILNGKVTVVAARFPLDINTKNIIITNNILYKTKDGSSTLGLIAQNDIIMGLEVPQDLEIDGALFAHKGRVIRHNYKTKIGECKFYNEAVRQNLYIYGSVISYLKSYWNYGQGEAGFGTDPESGFSHRVLIYDPTLYYTPPPYFPSSGQIELLSWEEY